MFLLACSAISSAGHYDTSRGIFSRGEQRFTISVDGIDREYVVHIPPAYIPERQWPLVMMFHGGGGRAKTDIRHSGWPEKADEAGFIVVFPEGTGPRPSRPGRFLTNPQTWNDGSSRPTVGAAERNVSDVQFVVAMLQELKSQFSVDERRVYATGFSNGASMSFRLARERSMDFAAIAPVAGTDWLVDVTPSRSVPVLYITGTADPLNPLEGGEVFIGSGSYGVKPAIEAMMDQWVQIHGCGDEPTEEYDHEGSRRLTYGCSGNPNAVGLYLLEGHGHHWPGSRTLLPRRLAGDNTTSVEAAEVIWEFFETQSLPAE